MNKPTCLIDLDGVCTDFVGGVLDMRGLAGCSQKGIRWDFIKSEEWARMGYDFWLDLLPTYFLPTIIAAAEETFGAENCCILTSPALTPGCVEGKRAWIKRHLPDYAKRVLFGSAKRFCAHDRAVLIDDYDKNVADFRAAGGHAVLVPQPWNERRDSFLDAAINDIYFYAPLFAEA